MKVIQVAVGVILNNGKVFLTRRHLDVHQGGKWEFPGGKVESDETVAQALARELKEEVSIDVLACQEFMTINHDYGDKQVKLEIFIVDQYLGEPNSAEGNDQQWVTLDELSNIDFPEANVAIVERLQTQQS
ncbi:8-oxo-dGTP diphosphatase MutT [Colwellia sp. MEBiC06753]